LIGLIVYVILSQGRQGGAPGERGFNAQDFMRIAETDRSLSGSDETGSGAFRETFEAAEGASITFEIPPGMTIEVSWELTGGSVELLLDPMWDDPSIVELSEGS